MCSVFVTGQVGLPLESAVATLMGGRSRPWPAFKNRNEEHVAAALMTVQAGQDAGMSELKTKWQRIQQRLRAELGDDLFNSWFGRMELDGFVGGQLLLSVPTRFLKSWVENHYLAKIQAAAGQELNGISTILMRVRAQGQPVAQSSMDRQQGLQSRPAPRPEAAATHLPTDVPPNDGSQTFETFMVGPSNQLAFAAASRVAQSAPGANLTFNPLYIHSPAGLGKSHLLNATAHRIRMASAGRRVLMLTAERFMYGFIQAVRSRDTLSFKDQFQSIDVLLIDDFQFLQGKAIQQEFCHAFNSLVDARRQVMIAADVPPSQLDGIDQRMRSRIMGGLVLDIEAPDATLRRRILGARHQLMLDKDQANHLPAEVLDLVAEKIQGGGRELEGALNRILAYQQFNNRPISVDLASMVLREALAQGAQDPGRIKIEDILKVVGRHYNVAKTDLLSPRRARTVVVPRQVGMYLAKKLTSRSLPEIGRRFGGRDHSTVLHAVRKIDDQMRVDEKLAKDVALLIRLVEQQQ
jgi:chromosomal replication initiator protein